LKQCVKNVMELNTLYPALSRERVGLMSVLLDQRLPSSLCAESLPSLFE
jgi:hypothetical protein